MNFKNSKGLDDQAPSLKQKQNSNLITEIKNRPELWCKSRTNPSKTREQRLFLWNDVKSILEIESVEETKRRWEILRDIFRREFKKGKFTNSNIYKSTWYHFDEMIFLKKVMHVRHHCCSNSTVEANISENEKQSSKKQCIRHKNLPQQQEKHERKEKRFFDEDEILKKNSKKDDQKQLTEKDVNFITDIKRERISIDEEFIPDITLFNGVLPFCTEQHQEYSSDNGSEEMETEYYNEYEKLQYHQSSFGISNKGIFESKKVPQQLNKNKRNLSKERPSTSSAPTIDSFPIPVRIQPEIRKTSKSCMSTSTPIAEAELFPLKYHENPSGSTSSTINLDQESIANKHINLHEEMIQTSDYHFAMSLVPFMKSVSESNKLRMRMRLVQIVLEENLKNNN